MTKWEYLVVDLHWDEREKNWTAKVDGKTMAGFSKVLNHFGQQGWELISLSGQSIDTHDLREHYIKMYISTFKRSI